MSAQTLDPGLAVVERLRGAMNEHDLDALVDVFDADVVSETPAHPQRTFRGSDQVRRNWEQIFAGVPDLRADLLDAVVQADTVWAEWDWHGTRRDGSDHRMRGVTILRLKTSRVVSVHFYMEPVDEAGVGPDDAVRRIVAGVQATRAPGATGTAVSR
ncbi:MAG: nuclear transport factor 2 family protein [Chloroflexota bacterium]